METTTAQARRAAWPIADTPLPLVVHVLDRLDVGGLETVMVELINRTAGSHFRHAVVCLSGYTDFRERLSAAEVPCFSVDKRAGKDPGAYWRLWRLFRRLRPDVVQTYNIGSIDAAVPAFLAGCRAIVHAEHGRSADDPDGTRVKYNRLRRGLAPLIRRYVTVSEDLTRWLSDTVRIPPDKIEHVYNGVDLARYRPPAAGETRTHLAGFAPPGTFLVGTVGRLDPIKDHGVLVDAFTRLVTDAGPEGERLRLAIVGAGPRAARLREQVAAAGLEEQVWLPGNRDDVPALIREFDVFVSSSINEGIALTILEAMACARPVVATRVGGNPELVSSDETGSLVPVNDPQALAAALRTYWHSPELGVARGNAGRARVERLFSMDTMVSRYVTLYTGLLGRGVTVAEESR